MTDGAPEYKPVGTDLLYVDNSESDVLVEIATQRHFVLLSGRWFAAPGFNGPWTLVASDRLPDTFQEIPEDSDVGHLRVWVAGTDEANEAVLDASIPQTAAIPRDQTIEVTYDGNPRFEDIEETSLSYATNMSEQVINNGNKYYFVKDGAWYLSDQAIGPWSVATEIPEEIREIPASSPAYNTKYVYIYDSTPEVVYVGYYPGLPQIQIQHPTGHPPRRRWCRGRRSHGCREGSLSGSASADGTAAIGARSAIGRIIEAMPAAGIKATVEASAPATPLDGSTAATGHRISTAETTSRAPRPRIDPPGSRTARRPHLHARRRTAPTTCTPIGRATCINERKTASGNSAREALISAPRPS